MQKLLSHLKSTPFVRGFGNQGPKRLFSNKNSTNPSFTFWNTALVGAGTLGIGALMFKGY
jgi:hypothetical protein